MGFRYPATWIILITLVVLLFGASRLPDLTRNLGKSLKIFKEEVRDLQDDSPRATIEQPPLPPAQEPAQAPDSTPTTPPAGTHSAVRHR